ncbi:MULTISPECIES: hypothetical protein [unclassified Cedecea]|uniref:hypothetical protein n=1 Tax=unclassified Cedecea TaxID=2649846 RepID=UPI0030181DBD
MRYYEINILDSKDKIIQQYSSHKNGAYNPGALMVEFDIMRFGESTPQGETHLTVWGIGPRDMQQARQNLYGKKIQIFVGMSKGLPLAGVWDKNLAIEGYIFQVFGNWQGTEMRLDFIIVTGPVTQSDNGEMSKLQITFPWNVGQKLSVALTQCFMRSGFKPNISISDRLILNYERDLFCSSLSELAKDLQAFSRSRIKDKGYTGVEIAIVNGNEIRVWDNDYANHPDGSAKNGAAKRSENPIKIKFTDLIGQPTWIEFNTVSVVCVMRADIQQGDHILMPEQAVPMIQASSYSQFRNDSAFKGVFEVSSVRMLGNSRQPTAEAWITVIEAYVKTEVGKK